MPARRHFGSVRKLTSGRYQASYWHNVTRHVAPNTFTTKGDAYAWLSTLEADILKGAWIAPSAGLETFGDFATSWLDRHQHLRPVLESSTRTFSTVTSYRRFAMSPSQTSRSVGFVHGTAS